MVHQWDEWLWVDEFEAFTRNCKTCKTITIEMKKNPCDKE